MATGGTSVFIVTDPNSVADGACTRCGGWRPGWGAGWDGKCCVVLQHGCGEVRNAVCSRCKGTGVEPPEYDWVFTGTWWKPWTWCDGYRVKVPNRTPGKPTGSGERYP
jgi:hypothetical protein